MITFASPLWLLAGALALLVPLVLHLIAPRPPMPAPLPTARFLEPQARVRRHLAHRPRDLDLLALRCAFLLLLFAALAAPRLVAARTGTVDVVLVDPLVAADSAAFATARGRVGEAATFVPFGGDGYAAALRTLPRHALDGTRADSVRAWWLTSPRWGAWTPGTATLRAAWPAPVGLLAVAAPDSADDTPRAAPGEVALLEPADPRIEAALRALGVAPRSIATLDGVRDARAVLLPTAAADSARIVALAEQGVAVVTWTDATTRGTLFFDDLALRDVAGAGLAPRPDENVVATWSDGRAAAGARPVGTGCVVRTGVALTAAATTRSPLFPTLLQHLVEACSGDESPVAALHLDAPALHLLAGDAEPGPVAVTSLAGAEGAGEPLVRWVLLAALLVALAETLVAGRRDRGTAAAPTGTFRA